MKIIDIEPVGTSNDLKIVFEAPTFLSWRVKRFGVRGNGTVWHHIDTGHSVSDGVWLMNLRAIWRKKMWEING